MNSKQKGKRGELEFSKFLQSLGVEARRGVQYSGTSDSPDVVSSLPVHWEVKRTEAFRLYPALRQAIRDASTSESVPVVAYRANKEDWVCVLRAEDLVGIIQRLETNAANFR